jgi:hypothetical protein
MDITYNKLEDGSFEVVVESDDQEEIENACLEWVKLTEALRNEYDVNIASAEEMMNFLDTCIDMIPDSFVEDDVPEEDIPKFA